MQWRMIPRFHRAVCTKAGRQVAYASVMSARLARCSRFSPIGENAESLPLNSSIDGLTIEHQLMLMSVGNELDRSHREGRWGVSPTRAAEIPNGWCLAARARPIPGGGRRPAAVV